MDLPQRLGDLTMGPQIMAALHRLEAQPARFRTQRRAMRGNEAQSGDLLADVLIVCHVLPKVLCGRARVVGSVSDGVDVVGQNVLGFSQPSPATDFRWIDIG